MARRRIKDKHLPPRVYQKHGAFYYVDRNNRWIRLGTTLPEAMAEWSSMVDAPVDARSMNDLLDRYMLQVAPRKAERGATFITVNASSPVEARSAFLRNLVKPSEPKPTFASGRSITPLLPDDLEDQDEILCETVDD